MTSWSCTDSGLAGLLKRERATDTAHDERCAIDIDGTPIRRRCRGVTVFREKAGEMREPSYDATRSRNDPRRTIEIVVSSCACRRWYWFSA
jgi:hypothetical protein